MNLLIESQYLPPVATFSVLKDCEQVTFDYHSYYVKGTYRNRCHICGVNGLQRLSVPLVKGKHQKTPLGEVKISYDEDWRKDHWQSIVSAYGRSAFFDFYRDDFEALLFADYDYLVELNQTFFNWLVVELEVEISSGKTAEYIESAKPAGFFDLRNGVHPQEKKSRVGFSLTPYEQVFSDKLEFVPNLSVIDLLFTQGPMSKKYL